MKYLELLGLEGAGGLKQSFISQLLMIDYSLDTGKDKNQLKRKFKVMRKTRIKSVKRARKSKF